MEKITAADLVRGSKRLDEMWAEVQLVVNMLRSFLEYEYFLGTHKLEGELRVDAYYTLWDLKFVEHELEIHVYTSGSSLLMRRVNPLRPGSDAVIRIHEALDPLVQKIEGVAPRIRSYYWAVLKASETVEK